MGEVSKNLLVGVCRYCGGWAVQALTLRKRLLYKGRGTQVIRYPSVKAAYEVAAQIRAGVSPDRGLDVKFWEVQERHVTKDDGRDHRGATGNAR